MTYLSLNKYHITVLVLFLFSTQSGWCQSNESWRKFIAHTIAKSYRPVEGINPNWIISTKRTVRASEWIDNRIHVLRKLDDHIYLVSADHDLLEKDYISRVWQANNLWKLSTIDPSILAKADRSGAFLIQVSHSATRNKEWLDQLKPVSRERGIYSYSGKISYVVGTLSAYPEVLSITQESQIPQVESLVKDMNLNANKVNKVHHDYPNYDGRNQIISIQENPYDVEDIDLKGRHIPSDLSSDESFSLHATDMATIVAGAGNSFVSGQGVLPASQITSSDFINVLPDEDSSYSLSGVTVQNHSYGTDIEPFYGIQAQAFDASAYTNPYLLHVFSSGNSGEETSSEGAYADVAGWANLTGNFKMSKNTLSIGAVDFERRGGSFSSKGPAYDGRIKPELVAYGQDGSSNSAALVSGVSGLLQQAYTEQTGRLLPSALLKAYLINSAEDAGSEGLDHTTGYGNVNAYLALESLLSKQSFVDTLSYGEQTNFSLQIPAGVKNLKVTLCWTDPSALVGNTTALVNDLDMILTSPESDIILPWVLETEADASLLQQKATHGTDHLNNIEQVSVALPIEGIYQLTVSGFDIPEGPQPFFVVYQWDEEDVFDWDYPTASDPVPFDGGSSSHIYWTSTFGSETGKIEYSLNDSDWTLLTEEVDLSTGFWKWENIPTAYSKAVLRMTVGEEAFESDDFVVSRPLSLGLGFDCADSIMLQWTRVPQAMAYEVANMGDLYLAPFATTADTFMIINKSALMSPFVSVRAQLVGGGHSISSYTVDRGQLAGTCYVSFFYQQELAEEGIKLHLELGTILGVSKIQIDRKVADEYVMLASIDTFSSTSLSVLDENPNEGLNEHRAIISFSNGEEIEVSVSDAYYISETELLVFPNPVKSLDRLGVFTAESTAEPIFKLYDTKGKEVLRHQMLSTRESINIGALQPGLYLFILENGSTQTRGKLIVR